MGADRSDELERVAEAVSDGTPVDWERERAASPELTNELLLLAKLEKLGEAHGGIASGSEALTQSEREPATAESGEPTAPFKWDRLNVLEKVGEGTGGKVYRAFDPVLQMEVALKLRRRDARWTQKDARNLVQEGRRLARVRHPNVLVVHGAGDYEGWAGIWTDLVRGRSLEDYLRRSGLLGAREAALIGLDLCRALAAVHAAGLIHRDIKPSNVMREDGGRIILADFGSMGEIPSPATESQGGFHGTPLTMAPEQLRNEAAGVAADLYGLGVLLYRMVTGRYPIEAKSLKELEDKHRRGEWIALRERRADLPLDFVAVVERALARDAGNRFRSAGEMERALAATVGMPSGGPAPTPSPGVPWFRYATGALAAVALIVIVLWGKRSLEPEPQPPAPPSSSISPVDGAAQPTPSPLTATVSLFRLSGKQTLPLSPEGGRIAPGDRLSMEVRGNEAMHVYVLNDDNEGSPYVLFPIPGLVPTNPLQPGVQHRLPGRLEDSLMYWTVTAPARRERIIAVASRKPLDELERVIEQLPRAERGKPIRFERLGEGVLIRLRGIGGMDAEPIQKDRGPLEEAIQGLSQRAKATGDVWVWEANLQNLPAP